MPRSNSYKNGFVISSARAPKKSSIVQVFHKINKNNKIEEVSEKPAPIYPSKVSRQQRDAKDHSQSMSIFSQAYNTKKILNGLGIVSIQTKDCPDGHVSIHYVHCTENDNSLTDYFIWKKCIEKFLFGNLVGFKCYSRDNSHSNLLDYEIRFSPQVELYGTIDTTKDVLKQNKISFEKCEESEVSGFDSFSGKGE